jgi:hypothetical protein
MLSAKMFFDVVEGAKQRPGPNVPPSRPADPTPAPVKDPPRVPPDPLLRDSEAPPKADPPYDKPVG